MIRTLLLVGFLYKMLIVAAQPYQSPFNPQQIVDFPKAREAYSFVVSGHFYGGAASGASGYPASTLLASIELINATEADLFLSTGDMFVDAAKDQERYQKAFFNKLEMPLINAVGNHDLDGDEYERLYGKTYFIVELGPDRLIVLDAEKDDSDLNADQLKLLRQTADAMEAGDLRNVFLLTHRPIWAEGLAKYENLFKENTRSLTGTNFNEQVMPLLDRMREHGQVYWFSGSMGGSGSASIFYDEYSEGIHFVQSAIRDKQQDAILHVQVASQGVAFNAISLTGRSMPPVSDLGMDFWKSRGSDSSFNSRLIPYYTKRMLTHRFFWYGCLFTIAVIALARRMYRRLG